MNDLPPPRKPLWRWIGLRMSMLAVGAVIAIALCMWLHFIWFDWITLHRMPEAERAELEFLTSHPHADETRLWQLFSVYYKIEDFLPGIANRDWILLASLVAGAIPFIVMFGFLFSRPLSKQFSTLATAAQRVAQGDFSTRLNASRDAPEEMQCLVSDFNIMTLQLERYEREIRESSAVIAHELRTPLNAAMGRVQGMMDEVFPRDLNQLAMVHRQLHQLNQLVSDLHLLSLAGAGQLTLNKSEFNLHELIIERLSWFDTQFVQSNICPVVTGLPSLLVTADRDRVGQVLNIAFENVVRYAAQGGHLAVDLSSAEAEITIAIRDRGPGFVPGDLDHAFDRFWRAERSRARYSGGSGLGLSIAKAICTAHDGAITARNRVAGGTEISLRLPA